MKKIVLLFFLVPTIAFGDEPAIGCPEGSYKIIEEPDIIIATTCPSGTFSAGVAESCLVANSMGSCIIYAPAGVSYTDSSGTYEFTEPCAME